MTAQSKRLNILFTTWEGGGNIPPVATAARQLIARGHRVRVMSDEASRRAIETSGAVFVPWREGPNRPNHDLVHDTVRDFDAVGPMGGIEKLRDVILAGGALGYARDTAAELDREDTDLIVSSEMTLGAMVAAEARGVPLAVLMANVSLLPIPGIPALGPGLPPPVNDEERAMHAAIAEGGRAMFNLGLPALNAARAAFGLRPLTELFAQTDWASHVLIGTSAAFDYPSGVLPPRFAYVGPLLGEPDWAAAWQSPWDKFDPRPSVLVSFSTTFQNQSAQIANTIAALGRLPVRALVTLGPAIKRASIGVVPENVTVRASAPHDRAMREAGVVVTHAGHGTVARALSHGRPLLCLPMGRDQNDNAARVAFHGAGLRLENTAGPAKIAAALKRLIGEGAFRDAARRLQGAILNDITAARLIGHLEEAAAAGRAPALAPAA
ncbi:4'-demethylrebeccamycin synthase [Alphaproteobacteria bacterium SO-S41]|nr:4'-demethylrebeccamycin synthase [Alphaproteobacteria bacterium SO-S41]